MSTPALVQQFYDDIWNTGDVSAVSYLLAAGFRFRGSLGVEITHHDGFIEYVRFVRGALSDYRCEIVDCVTEGDRAFAQMRFSGTHVGPFRGYEPTNKPVSWLGAALFRFDGNLISDLWVLGDLAGLDAVLTANKG